MRIAKFTYGIGYGRHADEMEFEDGTTDEEIEQAIQEVVLEKLDWGFEITDAPDEKSS